MRLTNTDRWSSQSSMCVWKSLALAELQVEAVCLRVPTAGFVPPLLRSKIWLLITQSTTTSLSGFARMSLYYSPLTLQGLFESAHWECILLFYQYKHREIFQQACVSSQQKGTRPEHSVSFIANVFFCTELRCRSERFNQIDPAENKAKEVAKKTPFFKFIAEILF